MSKNLPRLLHGLVGENLSGVTFVQDYLQLQFNPPPILNVYGHITVACDGLRIEQGQESFANAVLRQINKVLTSITEVPGKILCLHFGDGSVIEIVIDPEKITGPEAGELVGDPKRWVVF
jgi:hypothetical protein